MKLVRIGGEVEVLGKNAAMKLMLEKAGYVPKPLLPPMPRIVDPALYLADVKTHLANKPMTAADEEAWNICDCLQVIVFDEEAQHA